MRATGFYRNPFSVVVSSALSAALSKAWCTILFTVSAIAPVGVFFAELSSASMSRENRQEMKFKDLPIDVSISDPAKANRLYIIGMRGSIKLVPVAPGRPAVIRARKVSAERGSETFENLSYSVRRDGPVLVIEPKTALSKTDWLSGAATAQPELHLEIEAPSVPTEVHLYAGSIQAVGWRSPLTASIQDGALRFSEGDGVLALSAFKGEIKIEKWKGAVQVESHAAKVSAVAIEGDVSVNNFSGETGLAGVKGRSIVKAKTGGSSAIGLEGGLEFLNGRGGFMISKIQGPIRGATDDGNVTVLLAGDPKDKDKQVTEADVVIDAIDGNVSVKPHADSAALLKLSTEEGTLTVPETIDAPNGSGPKVLTARLKGTVRGTITVRSKHGSIRIR